MRSPSGSLFRSICTFLSPSFLPPHRHENHFLLLLLVWGGFVIQFLRLVESEKSFSLLPSIIIAHRSGGSGGGGVAVMSVGRE